MGLRFLLVIGILVLAEYYSFILIRSVVRSLPAPWRITALSAYVLLTIVSWSGLLLFRVINWAEVPHALRNIYIAFVVGFIVGKILVLLVMLVDDLRRLFTWLIGLLAYGNKAAEGNDVGRNIERSVFLKQTALVLGGLSLAGFFYGLSNRYNYRVRKIKLKFASVPAAFKGLRIVQISDIHTGSFDNHGAVAHGIQRVLDQNADMILFTGDLVNNHADEVDARYQEIFSRLKAPMGVYSTLGNHDYGDYVSWPSEQAKIDNLNKLKGIHASMGWKLMMNEHIVFERGGDKIALIGIENWGNKGNFPKYGDMKKAYAGLPEKNVPFKILMSHDPSHWDGQVRPYYPDVQLTLSGHTHGMQFGVDSKWLKWSPIKYMYRQWAGVYEEGEQKLYVNRGFGFLGYPGRIGILPEITVLEFV